MQTPNDAVIVAVDRELYTPDQAVSATVTNRLPTSISALGGKATCSILGLQTQTAAGWRGAMVARCPHGRAAVTVEVKAGAVYAARIVAGYTGFKVATFPIGTYRLVLSYSVSGDDTGEARGLGRQLL